MLRCKPQATLNNNLREGDPSLLRLKPLAQAIALLLVASGAQAQTAFSSSWFAAKGAAQAANAARGGSGTPLPGTPPPLAQQQRANQQLQTSLKNLNNTVAAIAAQQAAQAAGRQAAFGQVQIVPDGLGEGGLKVDNSLTQAWINAQGPQQTQADGKTTVTINQTADKAILNWETFNVGRNTTVDFQQQSNWAVLNRVNDPQARPSQIQGQIKGDGTVMIVNRNGIVFSGTSQVDVRNLVAAAGKITDQQFIQNGLYVDSTGSQPTFTDAAGKVLVEQGAIVQTRQPATSTDAGGYVLLMGSEVNNAGTIITPKGQTTLAAGDSFYIRRGAGTSGNQRATTRGNEVATNRNAGSTSGSVSNDGLIQASTGDITLTGHQVQQNGVLLASTSVDTRGTIHLLNSASDSTGSVALNPGSVSAILLDSSDSTALDSQRAAALAALNGLANNLITGKFDNLSSVVDRGDQSRVEIVSGGTVDFQNGSLTLATGGQVAVSAGVRSLVRDGSIIDVAGAVGVKVAMDTNSIKVNVQGNEQRDSAGNRDSGVLNSNDVWVDVRDLVLVPAGTNGYASDRWYTAGGLLEVGGYLGTQGHGVGEWMAQGGTVTFTGKDVVTQQGAQVNLSGGTLDVQSGYIRQTWLRGPNGRLYELSRAPGDLVYTGIYQGFEDHSERWGQTDYYYNPLIAPTKRYEQGYTVGRDAGKLVVSTSNAVLEGQIIGEVFTGDRQTQAPVQSLDGYQQAQTAVARRAQLIVGNYTPFYDSASAAVRYNLSPTLNQVSIGREAQNSSADIGLTTAIASERQGKLYLSGDQLNGFELGAVKVAAKQGIQVDGDLQVANSGDITLYAPNVTVNANLTAHAGSLNLGNVLNQIDISTAKVVDQVLASATGVQPAVILGQGVQLDASGLWSNLLLDTDDLSALPFVNGGKVSVRSSGDLRQLQDGLIDVSSGAAMQANGKVTGGKGGDLTLTAASGLVAGTGQLSLQGQIRGEGVSGAGSLVLRADTVQIGASDTEPAAGVLQLDGDFFTKGFSAYDITGNHGLTVTEGTKVEVTRPVYRVTDQARTTATGDARAAALESWTPLLYQEDPAKGVLTQRGGASLALNAGTQSSTAADLANVALTVGRGSAITVDPGQSINLNGIGQITLDGTLNAWGGSVSLLNIVTGASDVEKPKGNDRSLWIGEQALIDVAARAVTAVDVRGQTYGKVAAGGKIVVGGRLDRDKGTVDAADMFVVIRDGARLEASGSQAVLDVPGQGNTLVASNGGSISIASNNGLYLDGSFSARSGGGTAAGGSLIVALGTPAYNNNTASDQVLIPRELVIEQVRDGSDLSDPLLSPSNAGAMLTYGHGRLGVNQVSTGGFDNLSLYSLGLISFAGDVSLGLGQSLELYSSTIGLTDAAAADSRINLSAPYLRLAGTPYTFEVGYSRPVASSGISSPRPDQATFNAQANLIDIRDTVLFGVKGSFTKPDRSSVSVERRGFETVNLVSEGDIRLLKGSQVVNAILGDSLRDLGTQLVTSEKLGLQAAQIYPTTQATAQFAADAITVSRSSTNTPDVPLSVFGSLQLSANTIEQGGVIRAPMGMVAVGTGLSKAVELLPGSLTSASAQGLLLPYGGTVDGQSYLYDGKDVKLFGAGADGNLLLGVSLGGQSISVSPQATLDLSGGGDLLGAGFISGRGGSTDARYNPLVQIGADGHFTLPGLSTNPVYALVPGVQPGYAPVAAERGASDPMVGQQITLSDGVPGLPAGTYTLMPSTYALLPGAFRVELNGLAGNGTVNGTQRLRNGSWSTAGQLSVANTGLQNSLKTQVILTSADVLRTYSQYNETSYAQFAVADAARLGVPRPALPVDAKTLLLNLTKGAQESAFSFQGVALFQPAKDGYGGTVAVSGGGSSSALEILGAGSQATPGFDGISLYGETLGALGASRLSIGALPTVTYGQSGNQIELNGRFGSVTVREGAQLSAAEVLLVSAGGGITLEQGAIINTLGRGQATFDSTQGYVYSVKNMLAVTNGQMNVLMAQPAPEERLGSIHIGVCNHTSCTNPTLMYSDGSIVAATLNAFDLSDKVNYGTRHLTLAVSGINVGDDQLLGDLAARKLLPAGLTLSRSLLDRLLQGDQQFGAPALETLELSARDSLNFYGTTTLDTFDANGVSRLKNLMLTTPAIYGGGAASDVATIHTANLIWNGSTKAPGSVITGGAGTGAGSLNINANSIEFGYGAFSQPDSVSSLARLALGFSTVNLAASERITANHRGSLAVYQQQGSYDPVSGYAYSGGNLNIVTPLLTGAAGSVNRITAGGAIDIGSQGGTAGSVSGQGGELSLTGDSIRLGTAVVLPSGKLSLSATHDLTLTDAAQIDMAGRAIPFNDLTQYSWGGDVSLESLQGNLRQAAGSRIDLSAQYNHGGELSAVALDSGAGLVELLGSVLGSASGYYDAGGTYMPYQTGSVEIRAQRLGSAGTLDQQFADLNQRLNAGGVYGSRSFQLKQGDLTIGNELKAGQVTVSVDNGSLLVNGTVDASGERVGSINLSAKNGLTVAGSAMLDAHGSRLRVDSYGKIIDSPNRAMIELDSGNGLLTLASGARIDLRHGTDVAVGSLAGQNDGRARGTLELDAPRIGGARGGDIAIDAAGSLDIQGARSIAVNGTWRYDDAAYGTDPAASGRPYQVIDQAYLDAKNLDSVAFINAALVNGNLMQGKLAGLYNSRYANAFHLRPAVEVVSATPNGDLVVQGDLDLSGYRYASVNPLTQKTGAYGSGEVGKLSLRAGGDLSIYGSINDGFTPPPATQDDKGWVLLPGIDFTGGDIVVPAAGVTLADGTSFPAGTRLNYDLPIKAATLASGTRLPALAVLSAPLTMPAGTVLAAAVRDASGNVLFAAGTLLSQAQTFAAGTQLDAGTVLTGAASLRAFIWPKNVPLPTIANATVTLNVVLLDGSLALKRGALIPSGTNVKLPDGVDSVALRSEVAGSQGRQWAVATMLPEGSQSWSIRLVAGSDTEAADNRIVQPHPVHGDLNLADSHYGMFGVRSSASLVWTQAAADELGDPSLAGQKIDEDYVKNMLGYGSISALCADIPYFCAVQSPYTWSATAADEIGDPTLTPGAPIDLAYVQQNLGYASLESLCADIPTLCVISASSDYDLVAGSTRSSVVRTGTGDLDLLAGNSLHMNSLYGVYTAGTSSTATSASDPYNLSRARGADGTVLNDDVGGYEALVDGGADSLYRAWYPDFGGNLTLKTGLDLTGNILLPATSVAGRPNDHDTDHDTSAVGNWLWRQGGNGSPTAWWINFGTYAPVTARSDQMVGFTGFGTLGGGDVDVRVGGNAGAVSTLLSSAMASNVNPRSQGLILAVGSTGRVAADGSLQLTGGGDLDLKVAGQVNVASKANDRGLTGALINLRGNVQVEASAVGNLKQSYGFLTGQQLPNEVRGFDPYTSSVASSTGGFTLVPGDATVSVATLGDQVIQTVIDPGRAPLASGTPFVSSDGSNAQAISWFSLWTGRTAIDLFSAGGNLTPYVLADGTDLGVMYPSILRAVAANGSLYYGNAASAWQVTPLILAPSDNSQLQLLAGDSIYAGGFTISRSDAAASAMATPQHAAFIALSNGRMVAGSGNLSPDGDRVDALGSILPLFAFGPNTASGQWTNSGEPSRFYALTGDLVGVNSGRTIVFTQSPGETRAGQTWYEGSGPVWMMAGRDIVGSGTRLGQSDGSGSSDSSLSFADTRSNLFINQNSNDVSIVSAGRDILYSNFDVAGPGTLEITAGRNILMEDKVAINSIGPVISGDSRPGAGIVLQAGVGPNGPDYVHFVQTYLDPANQLDSGASLISQPSKVAKTYETELAQWLKARYGFSGTVEEARAYYAALPAEQQRIFAREVYFAELKASGREFNEVDGPRTGSYLRGREAIAALFPTTDVAGNRINYQGDITMFGGAGVHTNFGGAIQMLTPGGGQLFGIEGSAPPSTAGIVTQGSGDIQLYARDSILLGQSRVMTTFGGSIQAWSAEGDINAGRGSKTTVVYTPPRRLYDNWGNVTLSPVVPSTGAGIATLNPIPEVPPGDIDLIAPLGTIDAGEAGIRVSGNVNFGALNVLNAANIQVQGKSSGIPLTATVNTGALTSASAAASSATQAAEGMARQQQAASRQNMPSVFSVQVINFGQEPLVPSRDGASRATPGYNPNSPVQVLGAGPLDERARARLTEEERGNLTL